MAKHAVVVAGSDPSTSWLIAEVEMEQTPAFGLRKGGGIGRSDRGSVRVVLTEPDVEHAGDPTLGYLSEALIAVDGTDYGVHSPPWISSFTELLSIDEPRKRFVGMVSGLDIHYDLGDAHPLLGRRMPDLDLVTANGPLRAFALLHAAGPVLMDFGASAALDVNPWADRVQLIEASYTGKWELPVLGAVTAPTAVLIRPDGYVAWVGERTAFGLREALTTWFGPPAAA